MSALSASKAALEVKKSYVVAGDIYTAAVCKNKKSKKREVKNLEEQSQGWLSKPTCNHHNARFFGIREKTLCPIFIN